MKNFNSLALFMFLFSAISYSCSKDESYIDPRFSDDLKENETSPFFNETKDVETFSRHTITAKNSAAPIRIGSRNLKSFFDSAIDDAKVYNKTLSKKINQKIV